MSEKIKFPYEYANDWAVWLAYELQKICKKIAIAGSLRRKKAQVGDIEILYIPKFITLPDPADMFANREVNQVDRALEHLQKEGILSKRKNKKGSEIYGEKNKLMKLSCGIPVDLFATNDDSWFNYLVCRTGPAESNIRIASRAKEIGWKWNPYGSGFSRGEEVRIMKSEKEVFKFVGLECWAPENRG